VSERVFIIGAGRVGQGLARAFRLAGEERGAAVEVVGLHGRRRSDLATSSGAFPHSMVDANAIIIAVRDDQIDGVVADLAEEGAAHPVLSPSSVVLHTSATAEPKEFAALSERGIGAGTFHPLLPFVRPERAAELLRGGWIGIDGDAAARAASRRLAAHLGARTLDIPAGRKAAYHAAAVFAANFPVVLAVLGAELLQSLGVPERSAEGAMESLMRAAVANIDGGSPAAALTGPVARGDAALVEKHLAALRREERFFGVYRRLSLAALPVAARRGTDARALADIERVLRDSA
jgi:predicted short-subunit dehydrogenase-like oxidoreductase (DUF2520 family)